MRYHKLQDDGGRTVYVGLDTLPAKHPVYVFLVLEDTKSWGDNPTYKYHISIRVSSPGYAGDNGITPAQIMDDYGLTESDRRHVDGQGLALILMERGTAPVLWQDGGNCKKDLLASARAKSRKVRAFFTSYMNRRQNAIGTTGWQLIQGII